MPTGLIEVTQDLIDQAKRGDSSHCMIAEAIKAAIPTARAITVDLASIRYTDNKAGKRYLMLTPPTAQQHLLWFDQGDERLKPFSFKLPRASQTVKASGARRRGQAVKGVPAKGQHAQMSLTPNADEGRGDPGRFGAGGSHGSVVKRGGTLPPIGPLAGGHSAEASVAHTIRHNPQLDRDDVRRGRIRSYGLREMAVE